MTREEIIGHFTKDGKCPKLYIHTFSLLRSNLASGGTYERILSPHIEISHDILSEKSGRQCHEDFGVMTVVSPEEKIKIGVWVNYSYSSSPTSGDPDRIWWSNAISEY